MMELTADERGLTQIRTNVYLLICCVQFIASCASLGTMEQEGARGPRMVFEEIVYDFGIAGPEEEVTHTFRFTNAGSFPLRIDKVDTDCGCMAALLSEKEIPPEGGGEIRAVFETRRYEGKQEKIITVYSNDPNSPEIELVIKGTIKRDVAVVPQGIHFGDVEKGEAAAARVRLLQLSPEPLKVHRIEADDRYLIVTMNPFEEENARGFNIEIRLKPDAPVGAMNEVITLHTNVKKRPRIDVPVYGVVKGR
jgi:hypothetical protein